MDSLSQIVLGAAVGEAVLGKKLGNRAVLWGAVAGTIPDLDVLAGPLMSEIDSLTFHRGPTHSILFAVIGAAFFGWLTDLFFKRHIYNLRWLKVLHVILLTAIFVVPGLLLLVFSPGIGSGLLLIGLLFMSFFLIRFLFKRHVSSNYELPSISFNSWYLLYFLGFLTHILLDCFTTYGTQCLWPFMDTRIAWNTISVVDPAYTIPFLILLLLAMRFSRFDKRRTWWNYAGLAVSSLYLSWTVFAKFQVERALRYSFDIENAKVLRMHSTPTIFNNLLWYGLIETQEGFYYTYFSLLDSENHKLEWNFVPNCFDVLWNKSEVPILEKLSWFSDGYCILDRDLSGSFIFRDLRFGNMDFMDRSPTSSSFVFYFQLIKNEKQQWDIVQRRPDVMNPSQMFQDLVTRIKGL